jgi:hypothetical protein
VLERFSRPGDNITVSLAIVVQAENLDAIFHETAPHSDTEHSAAGL